MPTGVYSIPQDVVIDRELRVQTGRSLREWAEEHCVSEAAVLDALEGRGRETLLGELATTLGVSIAALRAA